MGGTDKPYPEQGRMGRLSVFFRRAGSLEIHGQTSLSMPPASSAMNRCTPWNGGLLSETCTYDKMRFSLVGLTAGLRRARRKRGPSRRIATGLDGGVGPTESPRHELPHLPAACEAINAESSVGGEPGGSRQHGGERKTTLRLRYGQIRLIRFSCTFGWAPGILRFPPAA